VDIEALLREADAADAAVRATLPTAEEERAIIAAAEALAGSEAGVPAKSRAVVERLVTKWLDFLEKHGNEYGWDESVGPTLEMAKHFQTWGFFNRTNFSTVGLDGMGDSWGQLAVPYLLPKYAFVKLGYVGWAELGAEALNVPPSYGLAISSGMPATARSCRRARNRTLPPLNERGHGIHTQGACERRNKSPTRSPSHNRGKAWAHIRPGRAHYSVSVTCQGYSPYHGALGLSFPPRRPASFEDRYRIELDGERRQVGIRT
jgi:hypothetical protein